MSAIIVSASRRTDLPGYHPEWTARRIRGIRRPIHSVFFWTKHPSAFSTPGPLQDLVRSGIENPFLHVTVTGLGGTRVEPNVPAWKTAMEALEKALEVFRGQSARILWRFDPVLPGVGAVRTFERIAAAMSGLGVRDCIVSLPAGMSLKGELEPQYAACGIGTWKEEAARLAVGRILDSAGRHAIRVRSCATPRLERWFPGVIEPASCISAALATALHPRGLEVPHEKDPAQRKRCTCTRSEDIGSYALTLCRSGCLYCYSRAGGPQECATSSGTPRQQRRDD